LTSVFGHLEITGQGTGFLRNIQTNFIPAPDDPAVPKALIDAHGLPDGIFIEGQAAVGKKKGRPSLEQIDAINGLPMLDFMKLPPLHKCTSIDPVERLTMARSTTDVTGRALDMIVPIGKGQRGLIVSPPKAGKTSLLKHMAGSILLHQPDALVFVLLVDERPEEVTDFRRDLSDAFVLYSSADQSTADHMRMAQLAMNSAIRCAEAGMDAVVFIDSLTRMSRAFNADTQSYGRTLSGGLAATALEIPRQLFGAARNIEHGGSLTVIASILVDTGSRMDDIIFQEFKGTGNMELVLNRDCAERRLFPAIDVRSSGTRKEHLLLGKEEAKETFEMRRALAKLDDVSALDMLLGHLDKG